MLASAPWRGSRLSVAEAPGRPVRRIGLGLGLAGLAIATQLLAARSPESVERLFSRGVYPFLGASIGCLTGLAPFSLAEAGVPVLGLLLLIGLVRLSRAPGGLRSRLLRLFGHAILSAGILYLAFLVLWGLNYQREPFARIAGLDARPASASELAALGEELVARADRARERVAEGADGVMRIPDGARGALARTTKGFEAAAVFYLPLAGRCARPKPVFFSTVLARLGVTGIYVPFTGEPNVNTTVPDPELPFSAAHEVAHQRGFAREDEANYLGYLACRLHPDTDFRYSGLLVASIYAGNALARVDRAAFDRIEARRSAPVRRDLDALVAWAVRYRGRAAAVSERVNDAYLRSQGEAEGVRSYGRMVDLLLAERRAGREGAPPESRLPLE